MPTEPTASEIRRQCWEIQRGWTKAERRRRAPWAIDARRVETKRIAVADAREAVSRVDGDGD